MLEDRSELLNEPEFSSTISVSNLKTIDYLNSKKHLLILFAINIASIVLLVSHTWIKSASLI